MIEARRGNFSVQTSGVTKGSGQVGQTVMVANLDSGRELRAKIGRSRSRSSGVLGTPMRVANIRTCCVVMAGLDGERL